MDHQTPMNVNRRDEPNARNLARGVGDPWRHILILGELQTQLLALEIAQGIPQASSAVVLLAIGGVIALVSLPVALACLALVLAETTAISLAGAFAVVSVLAVSTSCGLIGVGCRELRKHAVGIPRTREEMSVNWKWLKDMSLGQHTSRRSSYEPANGRV